MESTVAYRGHVVVGEGKVISYQQMSDGEVFINLNDMRRATGLEPFSPDEKLREEIEAKVFKHLVECVNESKTMFSENDIIDSFERVRAKLFDGDSKPAASLAQNCWADRKDYVPNLHDPRSTTKEKPSNTLAKVEQPSTSSYSFEQRCATRVKPPNTFGKVNMPAQESPKAQISKVSKTESIPQVKRINLDVGRYKLTVTYPYAPNTLIFYARFLNNMDIVENIMSHVNSVDCLLPVIEKPLKDMLVVVQFKELWYRGVVIHECRPQGYAIVTLLDYGNREEIECNIRQMSEIMRKIPAQAIRFNINNNALMDVPTLKIHQEIEVAVTEIVNWDNNEPIYMVNINRILGSAEKLRRTLIESQPKESVRFAPVAKCFMKIAESSAIIAPDRMLRIVHYRKDKLIVRTNELANLTKKVVKHVAWMKKKQLSAVANPKVGQYVLCNCFDFGDGLVRAFIKEINGEWASLQLIDFFREETLPLTSLRNIDKTLASLPPALIEINYPPLERATDEGITLLRSLIEKKPRIRSIEVNGHIDFTVDGELLSTKITSQLTPPKLDAISRSHTTISENKKSVQTLFRDMPFVEPKKSRAPYACFSYHGATLTLVEWSPERRRLIEKLTSLAIPGDNEPFEPVQFGMCLAIREGFWCRAMATGDDDDKTIEVKFVDYGNIAKVDRANIRKLPEEM